MAAYALTYPFVFVKQRLKPSNVEEYKIPKWRDRKTCYGKLCCPKRKVSES